MYAYYPANFLRSLPSDELLDETFINILLLLLFLLMIPASLHLGFHCNYCLRLSPNEYLSKLKMEETHIVIFFSKPDRNCIWIFPLLAILKDSKIFSLI